MTKSSLVDLIEQVKITKKHAKMSHKVGHRKAYTRAKTKKPLNIKSTLPAQNLLSLDIPRLSLVISKKRKTFNCTYRST